MEIWYIYLGLTIFILAVVAYVFFSVGPILRLRFEPTQRPDQELSTISDHSDHPTVFRPRLKQKVFYRTLTGRWLVARVVGDDGKGGYLLRRPRHRLFFRRPLTQIRPRHN